MSQSLDPASWRSICFEGIDMPPSLMGISILIVVDDFTEKTGDWIWKLPHCVGVRKSGSARWCVDSAREIIRYLTESREEVLAMIVDRLQPHGFDPELTLAEWNESLSKILGIASAMEGYCSWIAEMDDAKP